MQGKTIAELHIGDAASVQRTITDADVRGFAAVTGDENPLHLDEETASASLFGQRVAHGMLAGSLFSAVLGMQLPGFGTVYLGQTLRFTKPVFLGDTLTATVRVTELIPEKNRAVLETVATNQRGETVVTGSATVLPPKK